jgi:homoserine O-succinyltransferase
MRDLTEAGYEVVTSSPGAGVDIFVRHGRGMSVCFQGHPEYEADRLLLEYRRDARRYIAGTQPHYPNLPRGYFAPETEIALIAFRDRVLSGEHGIDFPADIAVPEIAPWRRKAEGLFRNWLNYIYEHRE